MIQSEPMREGRPGVARVLVFGLIVLAALLRTTQASSTSSVLTSDPGAHLQWGLEMIGAEAAWEVSRGGGMTIAIVDSGIDVNHEDLQSGKLVAAVTCMGTNGDVGACVPGGIDDAGHGTHVAGIAAANTDNGLGVAGVAPDATILAIRVLQQDCDGSGTCEATGNANDVAAAIRYATDHGADVINLSLGTTRQSIFGPAFASAIDYAWGHGVIPVIATGNDVILSTGFTDENAIVVGGLTRSGDRASYSNGVGAARWAISAPGGERDSPTSCQAEPQGVLSTYWVTGQVDSYACLAGTSMAAPHVAGAAAILRSAGLSQQATVERLLNTARDIGPPGRDATFGAGALDLAAATASLRLPGDGTTTTPTAPPPPPPDDDPDPGGSGPTTTLAPTTGTTATTSTVPPPVIDLVPDTSTPNQRAQVTASGVDGGGDDLPAGPVTVAALAAIAVGGASGWMLIRNAGWARRTPG